MKNLLFISLLIISSLSNSNAQFDDEEVDVRAVDYTKYDKIAMSNKEESFSSVEELASSLTKGVDEDYGRNRILFRWITENITYNPKGEFIPEEILEVKAANTEGFVNLLVEACDEANIWAEKVEGFAKREPEDINLDVSRFNHFWLKVSLEDSLYLSDPKWAAGNYNKKLKRYIRVFSDTYCISDPYDFSLTHIPVDKKNAIIKTQSLSQFARTPIYYDHYINFGITTPEPLKGMVSKSLTIQFTSEEKITKAELIFPQSDDGPADLKLRTTDTGYEIGYVFDPTEIGGFKIKLNGKDIWGFNKFNK